MPINKYLNRVKKREINKYFSRYKLFSGAINVLLTSILFLIRFILKNIAYKNGNIVIISLSKLGDSVLAIPAIKVIQEFYKRKVIIYCYPESVPVFKSGLTDVEYCTIDHKHFYFNKRIASSKARKILKSLRPEILFDFSGVMTSASMIFNLRAKKIIGMNREQFKAIYDYYIPVRKIPHLMDIYIDIIASLIPISNREQIKFFSENTSTKDKILIHPFAGWKAKEWNLKKFVKIAELLKEEYDISLIAPINTIPNDILYEIKNKEIFVIETVSVDDLIKHIRKCSLLIGNDSGPIHIASMLGKSTFSIFGPTNPEYHVPLGSHHSFINFKVRCSPGSMEKVCFTNGGRIGCPSFECMNQLSLDTTILSLKEFIEKINIPKKILNPTL